MSVNKNAEFDHSGTSNNNKNSFPEAGIPNLRRAENPNK